MPLEQEVKLLAAEAEKIGNIALKLAQAPQNVHEDFGIVTLLANGRLFDISLDGMHAMNYPNLPRFFIQNRWITHFQLRRLGEDDFFDLNVGNDADEAMDFDPEHKMVCLSLEFKENGEWRRGNSTIFNSAENGEQLEAQEFEIAGGALSAMQTWLQDAVNVLDTGLVS